MDCHRGEFATDWRRAQPFGCAIVIVAMCLCGENALAQVSVKVCESIEIRSVTVSTPPEPWTPDAQTVRLPATQVSQVTESQVQILMSGPVLGAMDSLKLGLDWKCRKDGVVLTATIIRSADFHGTVA